MNRSSHSFIVWRSALVLAISLFGGWLPAGLLAGELSGSGQHSLAIGVNQPFGYAWGANQAGQVGTEPGRNRAYPFRWAPGAPAAAVTGNVWTQVASGDWHSVALRDDGTVWTWGQNSKGQLGNGLIDSRLPPASQPEPHQVNGLSNVIAVAAGKYHSLALTRDGRVWGWGDNVNRQLGDNGTTTAPTPVPVVIRVPGDGVTRPDTFPPLSGVVAIATSSIHGVALTADGKVRAWGDNNYGQLGTGNTLGSATAQEVTGLPRVRAIAAGGTVRQTTQPSGEVLVAATAYTLAVAEDGTLWGWGHNGKCPLGESTWERQTTPRELLNLTGSLSGEIRALAGGGAHGVALTADGRAWTWGNNDAGQLGDETPGFRCEQRPVAELSDVEIISAGEAHTLVARRDGTVWAWGKNDKGQLGDGTASDRPTPEPVKGICQVGRLNLKAAPPSGCPLTLDTAGDGGGVVGGAGEYAAEAPVSLTATPDAGSRFEGWSPLPCAERFPMPARALTCTARFTRDQTVTHALTLNVRGAGGGAVDGGGRYAAGDRVTLTAEPDLNSAFTGWSPAPCAASFIMPAAPLSCAASFEPLPMVLLTVVVDAENAAGTAGGGGLYQAGRTVILTATPDVDAEAQFVTWSPLPCASIFTMPAEPLTCTASFRTRSVDYFIGELIRHYYYAILRRPPDPGGQAFWQGEAARLRDLGLDLPEAFRVMAGQFFTLDEYRGRNASDEQYVTDLYRTFFQRDPDSGGLGHWTGQLAAGLPRDIILYEFLFSPEFTTYMQDLFGAAASRSEVITVADFYRGLLGRLPEDEGFVYWVGRFQAAQCQGADAITAAAEEISRLFATGGEYLIRERTNREYLQDLYNAFLRRGADLEGFNYWLSRLDDGTLSREQARRAFIATPEFQGRVRQMIQQGCSYRVTATAGIGGSISPASRTVNRGGTTTFTVTPDSGYAIEAVTGCDGTLTGPRYTTGAIDAPCVVTASFVRSAPTTYALTVSQTGTGSGTVGGGGNYAAGATVNLTATPASGSTFAGWSPSPCASSFAMPASALTCTATFTLAAPTTYPLTVSQTGTGGGTVGGGGDYAAGATVNLTATPASGSTFAGWSPSPCASSFAMPANALTCTATFTLAAPTSYPYPVAKTGQTTSYAAGDDGALQKGVAWPNPRFTDHGNGTVTDNLTGLVWLKNADCAGWMNWDNATTWAAALASGSCGLTDSSVAGQWRLPTVKELSSLVNAGASGTALPASHPFTGVQFDRYWSATPYANVSGRAWLVSLGDGEAVASYESGDFGVWPVRGGL